jgi:hypothetical protein
MTPHEHQEDKQPEVSCLASSVPAEAGISVVVFLRHDEEYMKEDVIRVTFERRQSMRDTDIHELEVQANIYISSQNIIIRYLTITCHSKSDVQILSLSWLDIEWILCTGFGEPDLWFLTHNDGLLIRR